MRINITSYREKYGRVSDWLLRFRKGLFAGMIAISAAAMAFGGNGYQAFAADDSSVKTGSETLAVEEVDLSDALQYGGLGTAVNDSEIATLASSYDTAAFEERLINAFREYETSIDVQDLGITIDEARNGAISSIISAHPEIISVSGSSYSYYPSTGLVASISISYYANGQAEQQELDNAIKAVDSKIDITGMTDEEIVLAYHEYLTSTVAYAYEPYLQGTLGSKHEYDMYGALINHSSVCQGYAETMFYFLKKAGLSCAIASSKNINHAWNIVKINGKWYHIDATWDDPVWDVPGRSLHKYFLVSFATMNSLTYSSNGKDRSDMVVGAQWGDTYTSATDTSFESGKFWNGIEKAIFYRDGYWYSIGMGSSETIYQITKYRYSTNISQTLYSGTAKWMVSSSSYYPGQYGAIYIQGSTLYFSTPDSLNKIDLTASPISAAEVVNIRSKYSTGYNMYALGEQDGKLVYIVANTPNIGREQDSTDSTKYNKKYDEYEVDICVSHTWDAGVVITSPTYTSTGKKKYTCTNCGETKTDTIDKLVCTNHKWDDGEVVTPATYKTEGQKKYTCENCGATKTEAIAKLVCTEHDWDDGVVVIQPTYDTKGTKKYTCKNCGATKTESMDEQTCKEHAWDDGEVVIQPTYKTEGQKKYTCENCEATKTEPIAKLVCTEHDWDDGEVVIQPTYKTEGQKKYTCENCGATKTEIIEKLVCTAHVWDTGVVTKEPTYTSTGTKEYTCTNCGETKTETIDKLVCTAHVWDTGVVTKEPTYTSTGTKVYICTNCGTTKAETIEKLVCTAHVWDAGTVTKASTYTTTGTKKYTCTNCGETKTEMIAKLVCTSHKWDAGVVTRKTSYTQAGVKKYTCKNCGTTKQQSISKLVLSATGARTAVTANGVRLAWNRVAAADGYKIYRKASNGSYKLIRTVAGSKTVTVTDTAVRSGVTYRYRICAYKGTAYGKKSEAKQLYIGRTRTKACNVATGVKLSWNKVAGAAGYRIYRKTGNSAYVCIRTVKSSTVAYVDKTVKSGNRYSYFVQPYKSSTKGACTKAGTLYMARPVVKGKASGRNIRISWTMVKGARQYKIYKKTGKGAYKPVKTVNNPGTLSWTDTNAAKGYTYYNVQAVSGSFKGAASAAVRIKR